MGVIFQGIQTYKYNMWTHTNKPTICNQNKLPIRVTNSPVTTNTEFTVIFEVRLHLNIFQNLQMSFLNTCAMSTHRTMYKRC